MTLRRSRAASRIRWTVSFALFWAAILAGCERDESVSVDRNREPETYVTMGPRQPVSPQDPTEIIFYRAHLYWRGEDVDGTVAGFRFAVDDTTDPGSWTYTTRTDSTFRFQAGEVGAREHLFLVRAVDNLGKQDPSPDTLRFEAFTLSAPTVEYKNNQIEVFGGGSRSARRGLSSGDTVLVNSNIKFVWSGRDDDGYIVRWESRFGSQEPVLHEREDTTRTVYGLASGPHQFLVSAFDDAGAISATGGLFDVISNFDPKTTITSVISSLPRPWLEGNPPTGDSTLIDTLNLSSPDEPDTIPTGSTLRFCWEGEDPDGPIARYFWKISFISGSTENECVDTISEPWIDSQGQPTTAPRPLDVTSLVVPVQLSVRGQDVYNNVENRPTVIPFYVNFRPTVDIDPVATVPSGTNVHFTFTADDHDGDPDSLTYAWTFDSPTAPSTFVHLDPLRIDAFFGPGETGNHQLRVWAQDLGGAASRSEPDAQSFTVTAPPGPEPSRRPGAPTLGTAVRRGGRP